MPSKLLADFLVPERNSFGLIRLLAALAVVFSHTFGLTSGNLASDPAVRWTGFSIGQHAVHVFFVLSGLLVTASLMRAPNLPAYFVSRALRIVPGLLVCTLFCAFLLGPIVSGLPLADYFKHSATYHYIAATMWLVTGRAPLPGVFAATPMGDIVNFSVWTLKYEVACYLALALAAFVGLLRSEKRALASCTLLFALILASYLSSDLVPRDSVGDTARRFALCFGLGSAAYFSRSQLIVSMAGLATAAFLYALAFDTRLQDPATAVLTAYGVLFAASFRMGALGRLTENTDLSFGIFLYGWPIGQLLLTIFPSLNAVDLTLLSLLLLLPIATMSWTLIEAPALTLRGKTNDRLGASSRPNHATLDVWNGLQPAMAGQDASVRKARSGNPAEEAPPMPPPMAPVLLQRVAAVSDRALPAEQLRYRRVEIQTA